MQNDSENEDSVDNIDFIDVNISASRAIEKTRKFLEQYHSAITFREIKLSEKTWIITMDVGLVNQHILQVRVDFESGQILDYMSLK
ncbi:MAG: hypothetical protein E6L00_00770 [Thaumarchaeota archaeon]|nr:MAG: hypothetical protein E6L02_03775 [Nitrososphaerota archaeon]TLX83487.1 MAG: hypothetical protein E6L00_00770 [Nitrososphaerota archaeon]